jgi:hypothetical protein
LEDAVKDWTLERHANARRLAASQEPTPAAMSALHGALGEIERLRGLVEAWQESASYACECPPAGCDCPGCSLARQHFAEVDDG